MLASLARIGLNRLRQRGQFLPLCGG